MKISLVVPVFNEEEAIPFFYEEVRHCSHFQDIDVELVFVDDGSHDNTRKLIKSFCEEDKGVVLVCFSRNFGKEAALFAGLSYATGDVVIPIDVDLQDPVDVIPAMLAEWRNGADVVLAKRADRKHDSYLKRRTAELFYKLHNQISHPPIEENVGDFRLMSRKVVTAILAMPERNLFMKGILSWVGFRTVVVEYERAARVAGNSKFNGWKLWNLALEGITSFSTVPLRMWTYVGSLVASLALGYALWMVVAKILWGNPVPGYPSLMTAILFLGGVQLVGIGVLGEYVGRIYLETKQRPRFVLQEVVNAVKPKIEKPILNKERSE